MWLTKNYIIFENSLPPHWVTSGTSTVCASVYDWLDFECMIYYKYHTRVVPPLCVIVYDWLDC